MSRFILIPYYFQYLKTGYTNKMFNKINYCSGLNLFLTIINDLRRNSKLLRCY